MIIQNRDGSILEEPEAPGGRRGPQIEEYYAAVPSRLVEADQTLIDRILRLALDTFQARRVTVRVHEDA